MLCQEGAHCKGEAEYVCDVYWGDNKRHEDSPSKVAGMKVQVHIEWMEELDAWGKRLQVEVKELQTELAEISRLNAEHEEANELLQKHLEELEVLEE